MTNEGDDEQQEATDRAAAANKVEQELLNSPVMQELTRVMLQYSRDIHTFAIANRVSTYEL